MTSQKRIEREAMQREAATSAFIEHKNEIDRLLAVITEERASLRCRP